MSFSEKLRDFSRAGHLPTLLTALLYFDFCFAVWVLNGAMAPYISQELGLDPAQKGFMVSVPVVAGALMRFPLGVLSQYIGRKRAAMLEMGVITLCLASGYLLVRSYTAVIAMGVALGVAGASFGVALSLGSGSYPPRYKGLAMGIAGAGNSGSVLALLFAPPLAKEYGWRAVYGLSVVPMAVALVLLAVFAREPQDREDKKLSDYLKIIVDRDAWVFNLVYSVTFGGFIGLTSFLPTLFHDHYGIAKESVGKYSAISVIMASLLRVAGGWLSDRIGGVRMLYGLCGVIAASVALAASLPASPWAMVGLLVVAFAAMGAGNGAVFQLVPLRFRGSTAVAGSLIGEVGALVGGFLPNAMGLGKKYTGSFAPGFWTIVGLTAASLVALALVVPSWTKSWMGAGGKAVEKDLAESGT
ncbi:nitrate/nitrite transporter [Polyangium aurulentum]|uniref:nitrate/nitrite transporter n=1 Tax=Polyangium aurulentum TaxID=2567896 RepID=UPI0010ADD980|nr:MFS transporter [Polyangium aurulentum]UQA55540.1 MFS transporter [Polyangium aurulentum]